MTRPLPTVHICQTCDERPASTAAAERHVKDSGHAVVERLDKEARRAS